MKFNKENVVKLIDDEKFQTLLSNLQFRWECESEYENKNDYAEVFNKFINNFFNVNDIKVKITLRPFGFSFNALYGYATKINTTLYVNTKISIGLKNDGTLIVKTKMI